MKTATELIACLCISYVAVTLYFLFIAFYVMPWFVWHCRDTNPAALCPAVEPFANTIGPSFFTQILIIAALTAILLSVVRMARRRS